MLQQTNDWIEDNRENMDILFLTNPQEWLNVVTKQDRYYKLDIDGVSNWNNHLILLYVALEMTAHDEDNLPVMELGCGDGSSRQLKSFCQLNDRPFLSYDSNKEWADKYGSAHIQDWQTSSVYDGNFSVCLIDEAPGENRYLSMQKLADKSKIIVIHDSESAATGYMLDKVWHLFKYRLNYNSEGACAAMVSNTIDVTKFDNCKLFEFLLETRIA